MSFQEFNSYKNHFAYIKSDRIIFSTTDDNIFLISKKDIAMSANGAIHINIGVDNNATGDKSYIIINSPKIQMGLQSKGSLEPIAKGDSTVSSLNSILDSLNNFSSSLKSAIGVGVGSISLVQVNAAADKLLNDIKTIQNDLDKIKSTISYTI